MRYRDEGAEEHERTNATNDPCGTTARTEAACLSVRTHKRSITVLREHAAAPAVACGYLFIIIENILYVHNSALRLGCYIL